MTYLRLSVLFLCLASTFIPGFCQRKSVTEFTVLSATCNLGEFGTAGGHISFSQWSDGGSTFISGYITNVTPGLHGWHIHEFGITDYEDPCGSAGGHFNPLNMTHGGPDAEVRHFGDLGNFEADADGIGIVSTTDNFVSLVGPTDRTVLGRTLVIHAGEDDLGLGGDEGSLATGNAGARVGCCVIVGT